MEDLAINLNIFRFGNPRPSSIGGATRGRRDREQRNETPQVTPEVSAPTPSIEIGDGSASRAARLVNLPNYIHTYI